MFVKSPDIKPILPSLLINPPSISPEVITVFPLTFPLTPSIVEDPLQLYNNPPVTRLLAVTILSVIFAEISPILATPVDFE